MNRTAASSSFDPIFQNEAPRNLLRLRDAASGLVEASVLLPKPVVLPLSAASDSARSVIIED